MFTYNSREKEEGFVALEFKSNNLYTMGGSALQQDKRNLSRLGLVHHWGGGGLSMIFLGKLNMHKQFIWCFKLSILQLFLYKDLEKIHIQLMKRFILSTEIRSFGGLNIYTNEEACQSTLTFVSNRNTLTLILHLLGHQLEL